MEVRETALIAIAAALSVQALISIAAMVVLLREWRRMHAVLDERLTSIAAHVEELAGPASALADEVRRAAVAMARCGDAASGVLRGSERVAQVVAAVAGGPRTMFVKAATTALARAVGGWARRRRSERRVSGDRSAETRLAAGSPIA